jgi:hypothetical protein
VQPEGCIIDVALLGLEVAGEASERTIHPQADASHSLNSKTKILLSKKDLKH